MQVNANGQSHDVDLIVDMDSSVSIIPESLYQTCFPTHDLSEHSSTGSFIVFMSATVLLVFDLIDLI